MSAPKKKPRKGQEANITVAEFKQWLSGVEDMQEDGWVPDAGQWAKIRAKVDLISDEDEPIATMQSQPQHAPPQYHEPAYQPSNGGYTGLVDPMSHYRQRAQQSMLEGDGIMMPSADPQANAADIGLQHASNQFG